MEEEIIQEVTAKLPPFFTRRIAEQALNGLLHRRTMANLDAKQIGPGGSMVRGKRMYQRQEFLNWLRSYLETSRASAQRKGNRKIRRDDRYITETT